MATLSHRLKARLRRFVQRQEGVMAAELILVMPVFLFAIIGTYTYWDAFRALNSALKASYTVSDMIAREMRPVDDTYLLGLHDVMQYMVGNDLPVEMRVSSITYSELRQRFEVEWSRSPNNDLPQLDTTSLQPLAQHIPILADGDAIILMETNVEFTPAFAETPSAFMYLTDEVFTQFIVTRPRFVPRICLKDVACG